MSLGFNIRGLLAPDRKRVVACWALYDDVNGQFPSEKTWVPPETPVPAPYKIHPIDGKGRGIVSKRDIKKGDLILRERPVLMIPQVIFGDNPLKTMEVTLLCLLYLLEQDDREKVVQLYNCKTLDEYGPLTGILRTNYITVSLPESKVCAKYASICLDMSYVNHSCTANSSCFFDQNSMTFGLRASRDIAFGEEITRSYVPEGLMHIERQTQLLQKYLFTCRCTLCSALPAAIATSDERRRFIEDTMVIIMSMWGNWLRGPPATAKARTRRDVQTVEAYLQALERENRYDVRSLALQQPALMYAALGDTKNFRKWTREVVKDMDEMATLSGKKEDDVEDWKRLLKNPKSFPMWDICNGGLEKARATYEGIVSRMIV